MMHLKAIALAAAIALPATLVGAQEQPSTEAFDLTSLTCWEVTSLPEDQAAFVMALMIGYLQGQADQSATTPASIVGQIETLDAKCVDTPDEPAINTLK